MYKKLLNIFISSLRCFNVPMQVGAAYVALDPGFPLSRIEHILEDCRPLLLVTQGGAPTPQGGYCKVIQWKDLQQQVRMQ